MPLALFPLLCVSPLLVLMAASDLARMRIPNLFVLLGLVVFVATAPLLELGELGARIAAGLIVFLIGFAGFSLRLLGGGDVKMMAMLMLFIPSQTLMLYSYCFSGSMLTGIVLIVLLRRVPKMRESGLVSLQADGALPMGVPIAASGLLHLALVSYIS